jgi:diamine N-acetyltransferase
MNFSVSIRKATTADIPVIIEIAEATWAPTYASILSQEQINYMYTHIYSSVALKKQMVTDKHQFILLYYNEIPSGFASVSEIEDKPQNFKLHKLYLLPALQGKGLGKMLMNAVTEEVQKQKGKLLYLNVNRHNTAFHFYKSCGFTIDKEVDIPIGPYWMNDYVMVKLL